MELEIWIKNKIYHVFTPFIQYKINKQEHLYLNCLSAQPVQCQILKEHFKDQTQPINQDLRLLLKL